EMEYPLRVHEYALVEDSGGAGRHRGGLGLRRVVSPVGHDCVFNGVGERFANQPWGLDGGEPGACGRFLLRRADGTLERLADKTGEVSMTPTERVIVETPGAGGHGRPAERTPDARLEDRRSGKFSQRYLDRFYS
ncbi:MAG: hydantoinase B/oxoprolinase family protein, partial [Gammaproteobacteria bacterium]|nr:hydantoinase B/oxoprolinase family protein [Gammaproteobacteria bacterium]